MVDKDMALTFSVRNNPGVYALLLGSGVSTEAGVPTGWGIVEDLIRQVADAEGKDPGPNPFEWYYEEYDQDPEYDVLIEDIAPSKEDRQALLKKYFEPTDEEREQGTKTPTEAHESIAWLIDEGYLNIVVTTNFDQLLEQALLERGITPVIISSPSDAKGAAPLAHQDAVILKLNGDYTEINIKNITEELEEYDPTIEDLLKQIFDEYGLIVCGWSGEWDVALREALLSCESRRYSTYWAYHGELEGSAETLTTHRDGIPIPISGASDFFSELKERVQALEGAESGAPLTRQVARERVKRYMSKEERKIDLSDLLRDETEEALKEINDEERFSANIEYNQENLEQRLSLYENLTGTLAVATTTCAYWGPEVPNSALQPLSETIRRLGSTTRQSSTVQKVWQDLKLYPAEFLMYGIGVASVESENWELINQLLHETELDAEGHPPQPAASVLNPWKAGSRIASGGKGNKLLRNRLKENLREHLKEFIPDDHRYEEQFYKFEALMDLMLLNNLDEESRLDGVQYVDTLYFESLLDDLQDEIDSEGENWGPIQVGMFNSSVDRVGLLIDELKEKYRW
jgi:hypothetical protein